jgi:hypothetical protein
MSIAAAAASETFNEFNKRQKGFDLKDFPIINLVIEYSVLEDWDLASEVFKSLMPVTFNLIVIDSKNNFAEIFPKLYRTDVYSPTIYPDSLDGDNKVLKIIDRISSNFFTNVNVFFFSTVFNCSITIEGVGRLLNTCHHNGERPLNIYAGCKKRMFVQPLKIGNFNIALSVDSSQLVWNEAKISNFDFSSFETDNETKYEDIFKSEVNLNFKNSFLLTAAIHCLQRQRHIRITAKEMSFNTIIRDIARFFRAFSFESQQFIESLLTFRHVETRPTPIVKQYNVIGLGGIGSNFVLIDQLYGKRNIDKVYDGDDLEVSNLSRTPLYNLTDVGKLKTDALAKKFKNIQRNPVMVTSENVNELEDLTGGTFTIDCRDKILPESIPNNCIFKLAYDGSEKISIMFNPKIFLNKLMMNGTGSYDTVPSTVTPPLMLSFISYYFLLISPKHILKKYDFEINMNLTKFLTDESYLADLEAQAEAEMNADAS